MIYIFFSNNKWFLHQGDLPVKPKQKEEYSYCNPSLIELENLIWDKAIADIKAKALEIANPEILQAMSHPEQKAFTLMYDGQEYVKEGEFSEWTGTFERKKYHTKIMSLDIDFEVAHLYQRRTRLDLMSPAEVAIYNASLEVEKAGADRRLTAASIKLQEARSLVADYIDNVNPITP
jgi:hypothetical protein